MKKFLGFFVAVVLLAVSFSTVFASGNCLPFLDQIPGFCSGNVWEYVTDAPDYDGFSVRPDGSWEIRQTVFVVNPPLPQLGGANFNKWILKVTSMFVDGRTNYKGQHFKELYFTLVLVCHPNGREIPRITFTIPSQSEYWDGGYVEGMSFYISNYQQAKTFACPASIPYMP